MYIRREARSSARIGHPDIEPGEKSNGRLLKRSIRIHSPFSGVPSSPPGKLDVPGLGRFLLALHGHLNVIIVISSQLVDMKVL